MQIRIRSLQFNGALFRRFVRLLVAAIFVWMMLSGCANATANIPVLVSSTLLPDIALGESGKGFTCTGLAYDATENAFYIGNCGKLLPEEKTFHATIVKVSKDDIRYLDEIRLYEIFPGMKDIQGLTIDRSDGSIFFCSFAEHKVRHISAAGVDLGAFDLVQPTGIAYDGRTDTLWALTYSDLLHLDKAGNLLEEIPFAVKGQDQIYLDEANDAIYITAGTNYAGENEVYRADLKTKTIVLAFELEDSYGIEGIYLQEDVMYILNDGYYHNALVPENRIHQYDISTLLTRKQYQEIMQNTSEHE